MTKDSYQRVGIIGSGRVARAMGLALADQSLHPLSFWGRNGGRARTAAASVGGSVIHDAATLMQRCDLLLLAVSDDAIGAVVEALSSSPIPPPAPFCIHLSGGSGVCVLEPLRAAGALTAAIHPVMTFTGDPAAEVTRMKGASFAITASDAAASEEARTLVSRLGGVAEYVEDDCRPLYHAALSHAANHMVTLLAGAMDALNAAGIQDPAALLAPLVRATLGNSLSKGFDALSGPLLRGDIQTIDDHLAAMTRACPDLLPAYRAMATATLARMEKRDGHPASDALHALLK
ncbi:Rossmann-like and DUF2520 domain-containing protein [Sphingobium lactosutens]|uniref:Cytoplasmic protein n=1 Tax=Sphingobium lactosutens DS20 TaxID=1331060 RepID=T0IM83_9SPHN|nr:DUF2520 domain-containing protein [Sphingobium lactosutens]EQB12880.1 hypothetical protein RLDS_19075 [Sphingobium lactosutens DS20]